MDFGLMGIDGFVTEPNKCSNGSGPKPTKHERSDPFQDDDDNRVFDCKIPKISDELGLRSDNNTNNNINNNNSFPKQQMLSFSNNNNNSNTKSEVDKNGQNLTFSCYQYSSYPRNLPGLGGGNMNGSFTGIRGPFTPAQWIELEHQAMIYKYFTANVPVPANLLLPIRKALTSSGFPGFSLGSYSPYSYGWGSFHLGFAGSTDPEPGRCRRTDGKKWRCSRDAVPDQKYCERHINRGRHRSRKPVESHTGQAAAGPTNTKGVPPLPSAMSSLVTSHGSGSNVVTIAQHQTTNVNGDDPVLNRLQQHHDQQGLSVMPSVPKQLVSLGDSLHFEFGLVPNDSLLNPSEKSSYTGYKSNNSLLEFNTEQSQDPYPIRHFIDDQSNRPPISWADEEKSDWTQLSMSGPMSLGPLGLSSASTSPNQDKTTLSKMGVAVPIVDDDTVGKQNAWKVPFTWGNNTMGGPLGEVLNNTSNAVGSCKGTGSPQLGASPTGVLHKSTFVSLSNSSSGGSPRGDNKMAI